MTCLTKQRKNYSCLFKSTDRELTNIVNLVRLKFFSAQTMNITDFWHGTLYSLVNYHQFFGEEFCFILQGLLTYFQEDDNLHKFGLS
jgi:hypothetical protein